MKKNKPDPEQNQEEGKTKPRGSKEPDFPQESDQGKDKLVPLKKGVTEDTDWIEEIKEQLERKKNS